MSHQASRHQLLRWISLVTAGFVLELGAAVAVVFIGSFLPMTLASSILLVLALAVGALGLVLLDRAGPPPKPERVIHRGPAAYGEPTEPTICPLCGERQGTIRIRNVVAVPEGQVPNPRPDVWICSVCAQNLTHQGSPQRGE
jgi:hypothetical protein